MPRYLSHPSPTAHFVGSVLTPHPDAVSADVDVWFALPPEPDSTQTWEGLRCRLVTPTTARVCSIPLFVYDLGWGDEVTVVASAEGPLVATARPIDGGATTFRVFLDHSISSTDDLGSVVDALGGMGCLIEGYSEQLLGVSCSDSLGVRVATHLAAEQRQGRLQYETGRQRP